MIFESIHIECQPHLNTIEGIRIVRYNDEDNSNLRSICTVRMVKRNIPS